MTTLSPHDRNHDATSSLARIPTEQPIVRDLSPVVAGIGDAGGPVALVDMNVVQLRDAALGLERLEHEYENMSGICATLKGGVFAEVKRKVGHGNYRAWLKENCPKSVKTAERYKRLWEAFAKSDSTVAFQTLTGDLANSVEALKQFQLDLAHPMVAKIAQWVDGRGAYQLMLDFPGSRGGDTSGSHKQLTSAEKHAAWLADCKTDFESALTALDRLHDKELWKAPSIPDTHRESAAELFLEMGRAFRAFNKSAAAK